MRSKAWLAAPVLLAHADVTKTLNIFQWVQNLGTRRYFCAQVAGAPPYCSIPGHGSQGQLAVHLYGVGVWRLN